MKIERRNLILSSVLSLFAPIQALFSASPENRKWTHYRETEKPCPLGPPRLFDRITGSELDKDNRLFIQKLNSETGDYQGLRGEFVKDHFGKKAWAMKWSKAKKGGIPFYGSFGCPVNVFLMRSVGL